MRGIFNGLIRADRWSADSYVRIAHIAVCDRGADRFSFRSANALSYSTGGTSRTCMTAECFSYSYHFTYNAYTRRERYARREMATAPSDARCSLHHCTSSSVIPVNRMRSTSAMSATFDASRAA